VVPGGWVCGRELDGLLAVSAADDVDVGDDSPVVVNGPSSSSVEGAPWIPCTT
jgi:hypothetical protein